jgi:hypothetical protein
MNDKAGTDRAALYRSLVQVELRAEIDRGAPAEFAEATVRSVVARLTQAPTNLHQSTPGLPAEFPLNLLHSPEGLYAAHFYIPPAP